MPVSGKTSPDEIPFLLDSDIPDMGAGDKAIAERVQAILEEENRQPLSWLKKGTKKQIIVCNSSGVPQYVTLGGDATLAEDGTLTLAEDAVGPSEIAANAVGEPELADGGVSSRKLKPSNGWVNATGSTELEAAAKALTGAKLEITPAVASYIYVWAQFGLEITEANAAGIVTCLVAGPEGAVGNRQHAKSTGLITVPLTMKLPLPAAVKSTVKLEAQISAGKATVLTGINSQTGFTYMVVSQ